MFKIKYKWRIDHLYFIFYRVFYKPAYEIVHDRHLLDISGNQLSLQLFKIFIRCRSIAFLELLILRVEILRSYRHIFWNTDLEKVKIFHSLRIMISSINDKIKLLKKLRITIKRLLQKYDRDIAANIISYIIISLVI